MKIISIILIVYSIILTATGFFGIKTNVFAEELNPFALITTQYDQEDNDSFENAISITGNNISFSNVETYYGTKAGTIGDSTDVDTYTLDVFCNSRLTINMTAYDSSYTNMLNYNFKIFKQNNSVNPSLSSMTLYYTSSETGCDDYFSQMVIAGTYFIRVYGVNGDYDSRQSYTFNYGVTVETKENINLDEYIPAHPNSYLIWKNDFHVFDDPKTALKSEQIVSYQYPLKHSLLEKYRQLNGLLSYEVFLWGVDLRNSLVYAIEEILIELSNVIQEIKAENAQLEVILELSNGMVSFICQQYNGDYFKKIFEHSPAVLTFLLGYFLKFESTIQYEFLCNYLWDLKTSLATGYGTSNYETIVLSKYSFLKNRSNVVSVGNQFCSNGLCGNVIYNKYQTNIISEIRRFNTIILDDSSAINVYGSLYESSINDDINEILG